MKIRFLLVLLGAAALSQAQSGKIERSSSIELHNGRFTISVVNTDVKAVIADLFTLANRRYTVEWDVSGEVNGKLGPLDLDTMLQRVLRQVDATFQTEKGVYRVMPKVVDLASIQINAISRQYEMEASPRTLYRIEVQEANAEDVLTDLAIIANTTIDVSPYVSGKVWISQSNVALEVALQDIVTQIGAHYEKRRNGYVILPGKK